MLTQLFNDPELMKVIVMTAAGLIFWPIGELIGKKIPDED